MEVSKAERQGIGEVGHQVGTYLIPWSRHWSSSPSPHPRKKKKKNNPTNNNNQTNKKHRREAVNFLNLGRARKP